MAPDNDLIFVCPRCKTHHADGVTTCTCGYNAQQVALIEWHLR